MRSLVVALVTILLSSLSAVAQEKLIVAGSASRGPTGELWEEVSKRLAADSGGLVEFDVRYGLTALCIGMGMGAAVLWENLGA